MNLCHVHKATGHGVLCSDGGGARLRGCLVEDCHEAAVYARHRRSRVDIEGGALRTCHWAVW